MSSGIELSTEQHFQVEQFNRALDGTSDPAQLRELAKQFLQAWQTQKAATNWVIRQQGLSSGQTDSVMRSLPHPSP